MLLTKVTTFVEIEKGLDKLRTKKSKSIDCGHIQH